MKQLQIVKELQELIPPLTGEEYNLLEQSILKEGVRDPIIVWGDIIIDGHNRYNICKNHNIDFETVDREFTDLDEVKIFIIENQLGRRNLTDEQRTYYIGRLYNENKKQHGGDRKSSGQNVHLKTAGKLSEAEGISEKTIRRASTYSNSIDSIKEIDSSVADDILSGRIKSTKQEISKFVTHDIEKQKQIVEGIKEGNNFDIICKEIKQTERVTDRVEKDKDYSKKPLEDRKYSIILLDPPWKYEHSKSHSRDIENHYPTMSLDELKGMDINKVVDEDCVMYMWTTSPKLAEAIELLNFWEFTYKTCAVWIKDKIGMGYYFRQQHELLLIATRGNPILPAPENRISSVLEYPRGKHSAKPVEVYDILDNMYPNIMKLELFSRGNDRENWMVWGFESS